MAETQAQVSRPAPGQPSVRSPSRRKMPPAEPPPEARTRRAVSSRVAAQTPCSDQRDAHLRPTPRRAAALPSPRWPVPAQQGQASVLRPLASTMMSAESSRAAARTPCLGRRAATAQPASSQQAQPAAAGVGTPRALPQASPQQAPVATAERVAAEPQRRLASPALVASIPAAARRPCWGRRGATALRAPPVAALQRRPRRWSPVAAAKAAGQPRPILRRQTAASNPAAARKPCSDRHGAPAVERQVQVQLVPIRQPAPAERRPSPPQARLVPAASSLPAAQMPCWDRLAAQAALPVSTPRQEQAVALLASPPRPEQMTAMQSPSPLA